MKLCLETLIIFAHRFSVLESIVIDFVNVPEGQKGPSIRFTKYDQMTKQQQEYVEDFSQFQNMLPSFISTDEPQKVLGYLITDTFYKQPNKSFTLKELESAVGGWNNDYQKVLDDVLKNKIIKMQKELRLDSIGRLRKTPCFSLVGDVYA